MGNVKSCKYCTKLFIPKNNKQIYCCKGCFYKSYSQRMYGDGAITALTVYLCHKWKLEGYSLAEIAEIKKCKIEDVKMALSVPLTETQKALAEQFYSPKGKRTVD